MVNNVTTAGPKAVLSTAVGYGENVVKSLACWIWRLTGNVIDHTFKPVESYIVKDLTDQGNLTDGCPSQDWKQIRYFTNSKAFRVLNTRTKFVEENLHINFLENQPNVAGTEPNWMFDIDSLTMSMNYQPVFAGTQTKIIQSKEHKKMTSADDARKEE
ncbi:hypothetical protein Tco_0382852 [Tanacetum coccineum]